MKHLRSLDHHNPKDRVLIVGGGPVGLTLGIALARYGIASQVIEKRTASAGESKGLMLSPASLHVYHALGVLAELEEGAYKVGSANLYWDSKRLYRLPFDALETPCNYLLMQPQPKTEEVLKLAYEGLGGCYRAGVELVDLNDNEGSESVTATVRDGETYETLQCAYLVGADGSRSSVRRLAAIDATGDSPDFMHFVLGDFIVDWPTGNLEETHYFVNELGFMIVLPLKPGYHRVFFKGEGSGRNKRELSFDDISKLVKKIAPIDFKLSEPIWLSSVPHHQKVADKFVKGRVFLAGDAAHSFSPMGGQGMNTGIQDAFNLAWRLAMSLSQCVQTNILAQYDRERRSVALSTAASVMVNTRVICREDRSIEGPLGNLIPTRKNVQFIRRKLPMLMAGIGLTYERSEFPSTDSRFHQQDMCGQLAPLKAHSRFSENIFDPLKFTLIYFAKPGNADIEKNLTGLLKRYGSILSLTVIGMPDAISGLIAHAARGIVDDGARLQTGFGANQGALVLVRPDLVVACQCSGLSFYALHEYLESLFQNNSHDLGEEAIEVVDELTLME